MVQREEIINYTHVYRNKLSVLLKPNVGIDIRVFPCEDGAIFIIKIGFNELNKEEIRPSSSSIEEAQNRAGLLGVDLSGVQNSRYYFKQNKIALVKISEKEWNEAAAQADIILLLSKFKKDSSNGTK